MGNLTAATALKKTIPFHHSLSIVLQGGVEPMKHSSARLSLCVHEYNSPAMLRSQLHGIPPLPVALTSFLPSPLQCSLSLAEEWCWGGVIKIFVRPEHPSHLSSGLWPVVSPYVDWLCFTSSIQNSFSVCTKEWVPVCWWTSGGLNKRVKEGSDSWVFLNV